MKKDDGIKISKRKYYWKWAKAGFPKRGRHKSFPDPNWNRAMKRKVK